MVSKAKAIRGSAQSISYIQSDKVLGDAMELDRYGIVSDDPNEILQEFRVMQEANEKCEKKPFLWLFLQVQKKTFQKQSFGRSPENTSKDWD